MHITSSYYRCRQHQDTLDLGVGGGFARAVDQAALDAEPKCCPWPKNEKPLSPSKRTLQRLARRYNSIHKDQVA
ncbi:MAG TPA: hypothetical protein DCX06_14430 [Opitutae bacterium]|mgnify:CR=1 FL=1|nr:hypothetical protein [Opitutae bacterium]